MIYIIYIIGLTFFKWVGSTTILGNPHITKSTSIFDFHNRKTLPRYHSYGAFSTFTVRFTKRPVLGSQIDHEMSEFWNFWISKQEPKKTQVFQHVSKKIMCILTFMKRNKTGKNRISSGFFYFCIPSQPWLKTCWKIWSLQDSTWAHRWWFETAGCQGFMRWLEAYETTCDLKETQIPFGCFQK